LYYNKGHPLSAKINSGPLIICLTLLFTQERDVTIVDPLGSLNNILKLTRQRRVSSHQNTSRNTNGNTQGRNFTAALTVGRVIQDQIH
jgi:hypothetical protein